MLTAADGSAALVFDAGGVGSRRCARRAGLDAPRRGLPRRGGAAALAPDGVLWIVARAPDRADVLAVYRFVPGGPPGK